MDANKYLQSDFVTLDFAKQNQDKTGIILSSGVEDTFENHTTMKFLVEFDGVQKEWRLNKATIKAFCDAWGSDTTKWRGMQFKVSADKVSGKDAIIGTPVK